MSLQGAFALLKLCGLFVICSTAATPEPKAKSGPYTSSAVGLKACGKPSQPYLANPVLTVSPDKNSIRKSLIRGNITVFKDTKNVMISIKEYYYEDGKWEMTFNVKNLNCRSQVIADLLESFQFVYDKKSCNFPKGFYKFEMDYNKLDHLWTVTRDYGRLLRRVEASTKAGTIVCLEFEEIVKPASH